MIDLTRHIEYLLFSESRVTVPSLGTFVAQPVSSRWVEEEELFLPPYRTVVFHKNPTDDGDTRLAQSLAKYYRMHQEDAYLQCLEYSEGIRQELQDNGSVDLGGIGVLIRDEATDDILLIPSEAGIASPTLYGLDSLHISPLQDIKSRMPQAENQAQEVAAPLTVSKDRITISIKRSLLGYAAAIAASVILFFGIATPVENTNLTPQQAAGTELFLLSNLTVGDSPAAPQEKAICNSSAETPVASTSQEATQEAPAAEQPSASKAPAATISGPQYAIVLASAVSMKNAQAYVERLEGMGYKACVQVTSKMNRVIIPGFATANEAYSQIRAMRQQSSEFEHAWTMEIK